MGEEQDLGAIAEPKEPRDAKEEEKRRSKEEKLDVSKPRTLPTSASRTPTTINLHGMSPTRCVSTPVTGQTEVGGQLG